jgi:hypothetical protein
MENTLNSVNGNLTGFFTDVVDYIKMLWDFIDALMKKFPFEIQKKG